MTRIPQDSNSFSDEYRLPLALQQYEIEACVSGQSNDESDFLRLEAWDVRLSRQVSILRLAIQQGQRESLLSRARQIAALKHPCFVKIHAIEVDNDFLWIISEKLDGIPLHDWIDTHRGEEETVIRHVLQLAKALQEAHCLGIAHGHLCSSYLKVDQANRIRIDHFRFAKIEAEKGNERIHRLDRFTEVAYLAPESFHDDRLSSSADMYALGVIFYEMLMGHLPFAELQGLALVATQLQTTSEQWPWSPAFSGGARALMLRLTSSDVQTRLNSQQIFDFVRDSLHIDPITGSLDSLSVQFLQQQIKQESLRYVPRRPWLIWGGAIMLAGVLTLFIGPWQPTWTKISAFVHPNSELQDLEQGMHAMSQFYRADMLEQAEKKFTQILQREPQHAEAIAGLSIVYSFRYNGDSKDEVWREKANAAAQQAMKIQSSLPTAMVAQALVLGSSQHQFELAKQTIRHAIEAAPQNLLAHQMQARIFIWSRKYDEGMKLTRQSIAQFPDDWYLWQMLGIMQLNQAQYSESAKSLRISVSKNPDVPHTYALLSQALDSQEQSQEALEVLQQGLQIGPSASLYNMLGQIKMSQRDFAGAANAFQKGLSPEAGNPQAYNIWMDYGEALLYLDGHQDESRQALQKALELIKVRAKMIPNDPWLMAMMARIYAHLGENDKAQELAEKALALSPKNPAARASLASVFALTNDMSKARRELEIARQLGFPEKYIKGDPIFDSLVREIQDKK